MKIFTLMVLTLLLVGCDQDKELENPTSDNSKVEVTKEEPVKASGRKVGTTFNFTTRKMGEPA